MTPNGIIGLDDLLAALGDLPENLQNRAVRAWAMRKARAVAKAAQSAAPRGLTGNLRQGIVARQASRKRMIALKSLGRAVVIGKAPAYHFHLINRGTGVRVGGPKSRKYSGRRFGVLRPNAFLQRAAQPILAQAQADIKGDLAKEVQRLLNSATKRTMSHVR
jgi:HK97 gp10 family phage protein